MFEGCHGISAREFSGLKRLSCFYYRPVSVVWMKKKPDMRSRGSRHNSAGRPNSLQHCHPWGIAIVTKETVIDRKELLQKHQS